MKNLKICRIKADMTQEELAQSLGLSRGQIISNYELGKSYPDIPRLIKMAALFGVSTDFLLGISDAPKIYERKHKESKDLMDFLTETIDGCIHPNILKYEEGNLSYYDARGKLKWATEGEEESRAKLVQMIIFMLQRDY